jgi:hypothetical protein
VADLEAAAVDAGLLSGSSLAAAHELGEVWECPLLARLPAAAGTGTNGSAGGSTCGTNGIQESAVRGPWLLAVSPYPVKPPHSPCNPVLYWVGSLDESATRQAQHSPRSLACTLSLVSAASVAWLGLAWLGLAWLGLAAPP